MQYGIITEEGLEIVEQGHEGAMEIVDEIPEVGEWQVAAFSRHEVLDGVIYRRYSIESSPRTRRSHVEYLAEEVAKRLLGQA